MRDNFANSEYITREKNFKNLKQRKKMRKRSSILDKYKEEIKEYLELGLSIRCIYLLINKKLQEENYHISYAGVISYINKHFK